MNRSYSEIMSSLSSKELLKIIEIEQNDYQPDAIKAAEQALAIKNLSQDELNLIRQEIHDEFLIQEQKANQPLGWGLKILTILLPGIIQLVISGILKSSGYDRKAKELTKWTLIGFLFYIVILVLIFTFL